MAAPNPPAPARDRIRDAAVALMARKGVAGATTQDIAKRAKCSQAAIYKYWDSKEALAREQFEAAQGRLIEAMEQGADRAKAPAERVLGTLFGLLGFARADPSEFAFLFQVFHSEYATWVAPLPKPRDVVLREIKAASRAGEVPASGVSQKTAFLLGMTIRLAFFERQNLVKGTPKSLEEGLWQAAAAVLET